jgi:uncharacterized protein (TIGR02466 family)
MAGLFFSYYNIKMQTLEFNTLSLFPTIIGSCVNVPLSEKVLTFAKEVLSNPQNLTNTWDYKNTYNNYNIPRTLVYKELESFIFDVSNTFSNNVLHSKRRFKDIQLFFSEMNYGDRHIPHAHPESILSGVFYLNDPENSASLRIHDPRPYINFISYESNHPSMESFYDIRPQTGLFLIWQSWVPHEVLKNLSEGRTTAVFNIV